MAIVMNVKNVDNPQITTKLKYNNKCESSTIYTPVIKNIQNIDGQQIMTMLKWNAKKIKKM